MVSAALLNARRALLACPGEGARAYEVFGQKVIVPGDGSSLWVITHDSDFAQGFVGLLGHAQAIGHAFHITTDDVLTWDQLYRIVGAAAGVEPKIVHIPSDFMVVCQPEMEGTLIGDKAVSVVFDNSKIKRFVPDYVATTRLATAGCPSSIIGSFQNSTAGRRYAGFDNSETSSESAQSAPLSRPRRFREGAPTKRQKRGWQRAKDDLSWQAQNLGSGGGKNAGLVRKRRGGGTRARVSNLTPLASE